MYRVGFFVCPGYEALDLAGPFSAFNLVATAVGHKPYELHVVSSSGGIVMGSAGFAISTKLYSLEKFDVVILVGGEIEPMLAADNIAAAKELTNNAVRIASVCTGAFLLAETGLLDSRRATTHWYHIEQLQSRFPLIKVEEDNIYTSDGHIWTSAGIASGIDLALAIIEKDMGVEVARDVSRP